MRLALNGMLKSGKVAHNCTAPSSSSSSSRNASLMKLSALSDMWEELHSIPKYLLWEKLEKHRY
jgi:hypothetical protein